ncbi:MAG: diaminopimelate decarboxylase [Promethearchaeota archaeon]|jgi:diaminopimelate decarboxylase
MKYNDWLKRKGLEYKEGCLNFVGVNTIEIAEKFGTPLYVISEELIRERYKRLKDELDSEYKNNSIHFAMKANSNLSVLKILDSEGASFDCTSTGEIYACFKAGISSNKIIYTGNMFTNDDFNFAVKNDILVNLDCLSQLKRLAKVYDDLGKEKEIVSFRINPEFGAGHHSHTITAGKTIKFGILENQVIEAYSKAKEFGFKKFGTHIHIGSGIIDAKDYEKAIDKYLTIIMKLADTLDIEFEFFDFGGGLGIPYRPEEEPLDLSLYKTNTVKKFQELVRKGKFNDPKFIIEPGRYLTAEACITLAQINTIKNNGFKLFAGTDAGFNTLIRPAMYGSYHHIIPCIEKKNEETFTYDVVGPICESGDITGKERKLPKLEEGEYIAILDTGAYGIAMSSSYNSRPRPAELLINDGQVFKIREGESLEDLVGNQEIPDHLN